MWRKFVVSTIVLFAGIIAWYFATLYGASPPQQGLLALTNATILVGEQLEPRTRATLLIQDGVIIAVEPSGQIQIPDSARTMDLTGYTVMPGLIDTHVHLSASDAGAVTSILDAVRFLPGTRRSLLENGVTTVRDLGNEPGGVLELRALIRSGELEGPRLFVAGPIFTTRGGHPVVTMGIEPDSGVVRVPASADEARMAVRELAAGKERVDLIKVVQDRGGTQRALEPIASEVLNAIVSEAHGQGLSVTAHWGTHQDLHDVLAAGVDVLEHLEHRDGRQGWPGGILPVLVARGIPLSPTLTVPDVKLGAHITHELSKDVAEFHAAGGRVLAGTDAGMPGVAFGPSIHRSLQLLVACGLSPREALEAATSASARALRASNIGAIEPGRAADLLVVSGNPLENIEATRNIALVFRDGRLVVDRR
jgi:imidazolonepropionase-like amidohydrolase